MKNFNSGLPLPKKFENELLIFFNYKWEKDRNYVVQTKEDKAILSELPSYVQTNLFKNFIYHDFLMNFK